MTHPSGLASTTLGIWRQRGDPSGVVYRAGDLKRPDHIDHGDFVWVALRLKYFAMFFGAEETNRVRLDGRD
eukprot:9914940-Lingulodinium_polyedra.AAC.1